jgi:hypothetical protein
LPIVGLDYKKEQRQRRLFGIHQVDVFLWDSQNYVDNFRSVGN